jgi:hypothetical protein
MVAALTRAAGAPPAASIVGDIESADADWPPAAW